MVASDDFTVVEYDEWQICQLVVLKTFSGELVGAKHSTMTRGLCPRKMVLGDDGTLVYTLPDQVCMVDLYETGNEPGGLEAKYVNQEAAENSNTYVGVSGADRMVVHGDRVFIISTQGQYLRAFSLQNGKPWTRAESGSGSELTTKSERSPDVEVYLSGHYLYLLSPQHLSAYEVDNPAPVRGIHRRRGIGIILCTCCLGGII